VDASVPIPASLDSLKQWAETHFAGRLVVSSKAAKAAKGSEFQDVGFVYKAVLLMAN
jgi:hypothetical protein